MHQGVPSYQQHTHLPDELVRLRRRHRRCHPPCSSRVGAAAKEHHRRGDAHRPQSRLAWLRWARVPCVDGQHGGSIHDGDSSSIGTQESSLAGQLDGHHGALTLGRWPLHLVLAEHAHRRSCCCLWHSCHLVLVHIHVPRQALQQHHLARRRRRQLRRHLDLDVCHQQPVEARPAQTRPSE